MYSLPRFAARAFSLSSSSIAPLGSRRFSSLIYRAPSIAISKTFNARHQRRWIGEDAASTQSEAQSQSSSATLQEPPQTEPEAAAATDSAPTTTETIEPGTKGEQPSVVVSVIDKAKSTAEQLGASVAGSSSEAAPVENKRNLYVGNLFFDIRSEDLRKEFERAGSILSAKVVTDPRGMSKGFGYVEFATEEDAQKAIDLYHMQNFEGRRLVVQPALPTAQRRTSREGHPSNRDDRRPSSPTKTLFIGNMSFDMSDRDLNSLFRTIKNVSAVRVAFDQRTGQPRGFAHVDFTDIESAQQAMAELKGKMVCGRMLRVDWSFSTGRAALGES